MSSLFEAIVNQLYETFNSPTTMVDVHLGTLATSAQPSELSDGVRRRAILSKESEPALTHIHDEAKKLSAIGRVRGVPALATFDRIVVPLRFSGFLVGWIFMIDANQNIAIEDVEAFQPIFDDAARHAYLQQHARYRAWSAVTGLLSQDESIKAAAAELVAELGIPKLGSPIRMVAINTEEPAGLTHTISWQRVFGLSAGYGEMAGHLVVIMNDGSTEAVRRATTLIDSLRLEVSATGVGIGAAVKNLTLARESYMTAVAALRFASSPIATSAVASWDQLGSWRTLLTLTGDQARNSIDARVAALLDRAPVQDLAMLRSFLERDSDVGSIATALHMHRTTVYARLRKLSQDFDLNWDHVEDRLSTIVGLRLNLLFAADSQEP